MKRLITLFIALALVGIVQAEETTLQGTVIDQDGNPIERAIVSGSEQYLNDSINTVETTTDSNGRFSLQMEWPDWIDVKADGYAPFKTDLYYNLKNNKIIVLYNAVDYKAGEMSSIVLPITPDKELGRYFRYDRIEEKRDLVFEREFNPQPNTPYIFIPYQDVHIDLTGMDFSAEINNIEDTYGVSFIGSYSSIAPLLMDNYEYWSIGNDGADTYNEMSDRDTVFCLPKAMHATLLLNFAYLRANNQLINNGFPEIVLHDPDEENEYPTIVSSYNEYYRQRLCNNAEWFFEEIPYPKQCLKHWEMYYHMRYGGSPKWSYYIEDGDSVIDNTSYTPVTISGDTLLYRQDGNKVFFKPKDYSPKEEILVLDYGLNPGDEFYTYEGKIFLVTKVEYAIEENVEASENGLKYWKYQDYAHFYGKRPPKIIHLKNEKNGEEDIWIEGFGSLNWGITPIEISYYLDYAVSDFPDIGPVASHTAMASDLFSGVWPTYNNEHYKRVRFEPEDLDMSRYYEENKSTGIEWEDYIKQQFPWTFSFNDDTLCVTGVMELNCLPTYGECIINGDYIDVSIIQYDEGLLDQPDCLYERYVNIKFPNFKSGVYKIGLKNMEHQIVTCGTDDYIPYVAENKEWKLGYRMHSTKGIEEIYTYYFSGDTIINPTDKHIYKKWMRQTTNKDCRQTEYIGAIYEDEKKVYQFMPEQNEAVLIFDFASNVGDTIEVYNKGSQEIETCIIRDKYREPHNYEGIPEFRLVSVEFPEYFWNWVEGLGAVNYWPDKNSRSIWFGEYLLMSCIQGNDTLYYRPDLTEDISEYWDEDGEVKKQKIDFTHVIKTKPTSPRVAANISLVEGEYSNAVLNIDFEGMNGRYKINVRKDGEQQDRFSANQETHNLQSLDVNLAGYPDGDYTVVVENDGESFTAHFALPLDGTGIESIHNSKFKIDNNAPVYDLSGRQVSASSAPKGIYIQGNKKIIKQ